MELSLVLLLCPYGNRDNFRGGNDPPLKQSPEFLETPMINIKKEHEDKIFMKESWINQDFNHEMFSHCAFENCDLTKSNFNSAKFVDCKFHQCNLSLVKIDGCRLQNIEFVGCKLVGINFGKCDPLFLELRFRKCLIDTCNFSNLDLKDALFDESVIRDTFFTDTNLSKANFSGSDLSKSIFHNTDLAEANFTKAINYSIDPLSNRLSKAKFSQPEVMALLDHLGIIIDKKIILILKDFEYFFFDNQLLCRSK